MMKLFIQACDYHTWRIISNVDLKMSKAEDGWEGYKKKAQPRIDQVICILALISHLDKLVVAVTHREMGRAPCCEKVGLKKGRWTAEEDVLLTKYIQANGEGSWRSLPKNAGLLRCGKSCRLRWINYLRADLKRGNFTSQEEEVIINLHATLGNR
ncbi:hypothetical protein GOBAR_DD09345 [Gossypium barbadense]|nr:hypothetical protein GOBAR_DD09345 [Gossypium barbadense]